MKQERRNGLIFYTVMMLVSGVLMWFIIRKGEHLQMAVQTSVPQNLNDGFSLFVKLITDHIRMPFGLLLLQVIAILFTCRIVGWIFNKLRQPSVIGEIVAGILLGPSILGYFMPDVSGFLFPAESLSNINILSQFGLILFMYSIGMELDMGEVKKNFRTSLLISHTSMIIPFALGVLMAYFTYDRYAYAETPFLPFALFIGIAMSITAFPVLARIIQEKKLTRTRLGTISLASAASGDLTAWCILACVIAITQAGSMLSAVYNILFSVVYMVIMFLVVRPLLQVTGNLYHNREVVSKPLTMLMFLMLLASSCVTELLGLHALFGAFIAGIVMPDNARFRKLMGEKVEDVSLTLFLPLFFASTGLRTEIGLLNTPAMWQLCGVFILVAIVGKFGGTLISARFTKESWKNSLLLSGLMNTRGLMELVILTIGYEMHILPPTIFVILILMTLVTTFMTMPLLSFIVRCFRRSERITLQKQERLKENEFNVLLSFGRAGNGQIMLDVAHQMFSRRKERLKLTALHLTVGTDVNPQDTGNFERVSFGPILYEAKKLNMLIQTRYEVSSSGAGPSIVSIANEEPCDFLLVGAGISMSDLSNDVEARTIYSSFFRFFKRITPPRFQFLPASLIQDKTKLFIEQSPCSVGIFVNRHFIQATRIILVVQSVDDLFLLDYVETLIASTRGTVSILNRSSFNSPGNEKLQAALTDFSARMKKEAPTLPVTLPEKNLMGESFSGQNFMLISYATWNLLSVECEEALKDMPSTLIIYHRDRKTGE
ncbi:MAG: cation:proton antiporter, partial [Tannerella sp.]|nr:cation:proton antiporter [Tannerella sp.]